MPTPDGARSRGHGFSIPGPLSLDVDDTDASYQGEHDSMTIR